MSLWALAERQHGVLARAQLLDAGFSRKAIKHRLDTGRLHAIRRGVYAVGRPQLTRHGLWMAAILSCGPGAALSHRSAGALWQIGVEGSEIELSVPLDRRSRGPGLMVHRRATLDDGRLTCHERIPVTIPVCTLVDLAGRLSRNELEAAISEADKRDLIDPDGLRAALEGLGGRPGVGVLRKTLYRHVFTVTDSELERLFLALARRAALPLPLTGAWVNGFKVDFFWPDLGLVVETDGLRYHRTPAQQVRDRRRDQAHAADGLTCLRFTYAQVRFDPNHVERTLSVVAGRALAP